MLFATELVSLVWIFCCVDWDKIEPPKSEGGQIEIDSVNADVECILKSRDIAEPTLYTEKEKLSVHFTKAASDAEVIFGVENNEEENRNLIE
jgi:hypothetical protein